MLDCVGIAPLTQATIMMAAPVVIVVAIGFVVAVYVVVATAWARHAGTCSEVLIWGAAPAEVLRNALLVSAFLVWPTFVGHVFQVLDCSVVVDGVSYLASDVSVSCDDPTHQALAVAPLYVCRIALLASAAPPPPTSAPPKHINYQEKPTVEIRNASS